MRHSGLQKQVLSLYRECLVATKRASKGDNTAAVQFVRSEFRRQVMRAAFCRPSCVGMSTTSVTQ
jgi:hypothetical protein